MTWERLKCHGLGVIGISVALLVVAVALLAPLLAPHDPLASDFAAGLKPPGTPGHPWGTDQLGSDLLSRVLYGARIALFIGQIGLHTVQPPFPVRRLIGEIFDVGVLSLAIICLSGATVGRAVSVFCRGT